GVGQGQEGIFRAPSRHSPRERTPARRTDADIRSYGGTRLVNVVFLLLTTAAAAAGSHTAAQSAPTSCSCCSGPNVEVITSGGDCCDKPSMCDRLRGMFRKKHDCCEQSCCNSTPAPCCAPAPAPAPCCKPAPTPCCNPAPAPCCNSAP